MLSFTTPRRFDPGTLGSLLDNRMCFDFVTRIFFPITLLLALLEVCATDLSTTGETLPSSGEGESLLRLDFVTSPNYKYVSQSCRVKKRRFRLRVLTGKVLLTCSQGMISATFRA